MKIFCLKKLEIQNVYIQQQQNIYYENMANPNHAQRLHVVKIENCFAISVCCEFTTTGIHSKWLPNYKII